MNRFFAPSLTVLALAMVATPAAAQELTGTLVGTVRTKSGQPMAGVVIRIASPALMGTRTVTTDEKGQFRAPMLPPGTYTATASKSGFISAKALADVGLGGVIRTDMALSEEKVSAEVVEVVATAATTDKTDVKASTLVTSEMMDVLPRTQRGLEDMAKLAPGVVSNSATNDRITIRGSQTTGNRVLLNGTDVSDNTYTGGNGRAFFVDDSIQEMQVIQSPVHARYGNFTGGVLNAITKSGGNDFSGVLRGNWRRPSWSAQAPLGDRPGSKPSNTGANYGEDLLGREYTLTMGGPIIKDMLWFQIGTKKNPASATARTLSNPGSAVKNSDGSNRWIPPGEGAAYVETADMKYREIKLTFAPISGHTLEISTSKQDSSTFDNLFGTSNDLDVLRDRLDTNEYYSASYRGIFGSSLTGELKLAQKKSTIQGGGKTGRPDKLDQRVEVRLSNGTTYGHHNSSFDYNEKKHRDVKTVSGNLTWFKGTDKGSHTVDAGFELLTYSQAEANWQTPTKNRVIVNGINPDKTYRLYRDVKAPGVPTGTPDVTRVMLYFGSEGRAESTQTSFYVNDLWAINENWQVMGGLRYDAAKASDTFGAETISSSKISPRLQVTWDIKGDGSWLARAHQAVYVGALHSGFVNKFTYVGSPYSEVYRPKANILNATYDQITNFTTNSPVWDISQAGFVSAGGGPTQFVDPKIKAPYSKETSLNLKHSFKDGSSMGFTYAKRSYNDFYNDFQRIGNEYSFKSMFAGGQEFWNAKTDWRTDNRIERELNSFELEWLFLLNKEWSFGGNWTISTLKGNGEGSDSTATSSSVGDVIGDFDEIFANKGIPVAAYYPDGYLMGHQPHRGTMYLNYEHTTLSKAKFNASLMLNYSAGSPYSITRSTDDDALMAAYYDLAPAGTYKLTKANYQGLSSSWTQFFGPRGFGRDNDTFNFDMKIGYDVPVWNKVRTFCELTVFNVFNHWQEQDYQRTITSGTATYGDPKSGYQAAPWVTDATGATGFGTRQYTNFTGGRSVRLSAGLKW